MICTVKVQGIIISINNQGCQKVQTESLTRQTFRNISKPDLCIVEINRDKHSPTWKLSYAAITGMYWSAQCATEGAGNEISKLAVHRGCLHWPQSSLHILALDWSSQAAHLPCGCVKAGAVLFLYSQRFPRPYLSTPKH